MFADLNSRLLDVDLVRIRAATCCDKDSLCAQLDTAVINRRDNNLVCFLTDGSRRSIGDDFDSFFYKNFADRFADLRFVAVSEQLVIALQNRDLDTEPAEHLPK